MYQYMLQDVVAAAAAALQSQGYCSLRELAGGYRAWDLQYRPDGRRRAKGAFRDKSSGASSDQCVCACMQVEKQQMGVEIWSGGTWEGQSELLG
jgi:hypothetical protein